MKILGKIVMTQHGVFAIDTPLLETAKKLGEPDAVMGDALPKTLTIELEVIKPYTLRGVPIVFKMKPKAKKVKKCT